MFVCVRGFFIDEDGKYNPIRGFSLFTLMIDVLTDKLLKPVKCFYVNTSYFIFFFSERKHSSLSESKRSMSNKTAAPRNMLLNIN